MTPHTARLYNVNTSADARRLRGLWRPAGLRYGRPGRDRALRALMVALAMAILIAGGLLALADIRTASTAPGQTVALDEEEQEFLALINAYRASLGAPALTVDPRLQAAARWMSQDMAANDYFSHYDSLGRDPFQRMAGFGYTYDVWKGENLAAGTADAQVAFDLWKASPGHNANMISVEFRGIGIARAYGAGRGLGWYWATDFGGAANGGPPAEPTPSPAPTPTPTPARQPTLTPTPPPAPTPQPSPKPTSAPTPGTTPVTSEPGVRGNMDCNRRIDARDALLVLRMIAFRTGTGCEAATPDVDRSRVTDPSDAVTILRHVARLPEGARPDCPALGAVG